MSRHPAIPALLLASLLSASCGKSDIVILQDKGSDTMVNLMQLLSEGYLGVGDKVVVAVTGGGSGTGIKSLKVGYNKIHGYYIEVTRANDGAVPPEYIRKQTLVNAERYITPEMKEVEAQVLNAEERILVGDR